MKVICKIAGGGTNCPRGLTICCGTCDHVAACGMPCDPNVRRDFQNCTDAEVINDEVTRFQSAVPATIQMITDVVQQKKELEDREIQQKEQLVKAMEAFGVKSFENDHIKLTYVAPTTRSTLDSTKLKKDHPDIVEQYSKTSNVSASVRITVK